MEKYSSEQLIKCPECGHEFENLKYEQEYWCPCGEFGVYVGYGSPSWLKPKKSWLELRIPLGPSQDTLDELLFQ